MRPLATLLLVAALAMVHVVAQEDASAAPAPENPKSEPKYTDTFSGPIVELSTAKITVSRSILGKPAEKRTFWIKEDTRIEGKLRMKVRVTVGFVTTDDGDVARLIVVRAVASKPPQEKK